MHGGRIRGLDEIVEKECISLGTHDQRTRIVAPQSAYIRAIFMYAARRTHHRRDQLRGLSAPNQEGRPRQDEPQQAVTRT